MMPNIYIQNNFFIFLLLSLLVCFNATSTKTEVKKSDPNDNKGNTPFFLQDPHDKMFINLLFYYMIKIIDITILMSKLI